MRNKQDNGKRSFATKDSGHVDGFEELILAMWIVGHWSNGDRLFIMLSL